VVGEGKRDSVTQAVRCVERTAREAGCSAAGFGGARSRLAVWRGGPISSVLDREGRLGNWWGESTEAVAIDIGLGGADGVVVDVAPNKGPGRMEAKGEERKDAAGAHTYVDADGILWDTKLARMGYRALERAGQKIFDPVDVICTLWYRGAEKSFWKLPVKVKIMSEQCLS
jgi:hypothetical protein